MQRCFIALGSNLEQPLLQVERAVEALKDLPESELKAVSPWYQSVAVGPDQPDYIMVLQNFIPLNHHRISWRYCKGLKTHNNVNACSAGDPEL